MNAAFFVLTMLLQRPPAGQDDARVLASAVYVPQRVYDTRRKAFTDFESMLAGLARTDAVLVGEQHDDPATHQLESAILQGLLRRGVPVTISMEMFERDVQPVLDRYLSGEIPESEFLKAARPWPRYATDYRPMVELARAHRWPVVAANVPRRYASDVAKSGKSAFDAVDARERSLVAQELRCPHDKYYERFAEQMNGHQGASPPAGSRSDKPAAADLATTERYYWSQCLKDETMAESIAAAVERRGAARGVVVHFTGAFHSDFGGGTTNRVRRRLGGRRVVVVSIVPMENLDTIAPKGSERKRADYLVYAQK
jgi:uncharacterized iron-regulated protein